MRSFVSSSRAGMGGGEGRAVVCVCLVLFCLLCSLLATESRQAPISKVVYRVVEQDTLILTL